MPPARPDEPGSLAVPLAVLRRRIRVAQAQEPGDLLLVGGRIVNVFTERIEPGSVIIADGWIAGVGAHDWRAHETVDLKGQLVFPGLIDSHMHLESSLLLPGELARLVVPHGTTAVISDSHEVGNVLGIPGIEQLIAASAGIPLDIFFMASSCVPAARWEDAGAVLGPQEVGQLLGHPRVLGLAEMMDMPAVWQAEGYVLEKIRAAALRQRPVDGHAPGLTGLPLQAYLAAGIRSDHESAGSEEARQKAAGGMLVQVREGSIARNLDTLLPLLVGNQLGDCWTLCTDDILPDDLRQQGHLDALVRRVLAAGVPAARALRQATLVPARHYGLADRGALAPGYRADLATADDPGDFRIRQVYKDGRLVARDGDYLGPAGGQVRADNTIHLAPLDASAFRLAPARDSGPVIRLIPGQLFTRAEPQPFQLRDGQWAFDAQRDVLLIASIERHQKKGRVGLGLVAGFGLRRHGALGSSVAHDSHNLIVAGSNPEDMLACVRSLEQSGGGFVVVADGEVKAQMPLPFAGLLSTLPADAACDQLRQVRQAAQALGCPLPCPFGALSFLALPVIPELRITDQGLFDVVGQRFVPL